jgi:hypothetical protein
VILTKTAKLKYKQVFEDRCEVIAERLGESRDNPMSDDEESLHSDKEQEEEKKEPQRRIVKAKRTIKSSGEITKPKLKPKPKSAQAKKAKDSEASDSDDDKEDVKMATEDPVALIGKKRKKPIVGDNKAASNHNLVQKARRLEDGSVKVKLIGDESNNQGSLT